MFRIEDLSPKDNSTNSLFSLNYIMNRDFNNILDEINQEADLE